MVDPQMERVTRRLTRLKLVATRERLDWPAPPYQGRGLTLPGVRRETAGLWSGYALPSSACLATRGSGVLSQRGAMVLAVDTRPWAPPMRLQLEVIWFCTCWRYLTKGKLPSSSPMRPTPPMAPPEALGPGTPVLGWAFPHFRPNCSVGFPA